MTIDIWNYYTKGDYVAGLGHALKSLAGTSGIDHLHIAGLCLMEMKRHDEGLALLRAAATLRPEAIHIYSNAAYVAEQAGLPKAAEQFADAGLRDFPDDIGLLLLKANSLVVQLRSTEADPLYRQILAADPTNVSAMINYGNCRRYEYDFAQASYWFDKAHAIDPNLRELVFAKAALASQLSEHSRVFELLAPYQNDADAQHMLASEYLAMGEYERGFQAYRARFRAFESGTYQRTATDRTNELRLFDHWSEATGKRIAVLQEGGFGDTLMLCRYIPMLAEVAAEVALFVPKPLKRLFDHNRATNVTIHAVDDPVASYDYVTTFFELPYHFRSGFSTVPHDIPYLREGVVRRRLPETTLKRIGLCWASGLARHMDYGNLDCDAGRSLNLSQLAPLARVDGVEFISLQLGQRAGQTCDGLDLTRVLDPTLDFLDTAAVIAQLDWVISVDTSVAHLAAAMGKPVWLLARYDVDWKWRSHGRPTAPWYPDVRLFQQQERGDWTSPVQEIAERLARGS